MTRRSTSDSIIGQMILASLARRGWSQRDLATVIGMSPAFVCDVVRGFRRVSPATALRLEAALGTPSAFWLDQQREADRLETAREAERLAVGMRDELAAIRAAVEARR